MQLGGRWLGGIFLVAVCVATLDLAGFAQSEDVPHTPWGHPDLQGVWGYQSSTPLQRDEAFGDKAVLTPEEAAAYVEEQHAAIARRGAVALNADWENPEGLTDNRTSLIADPADGRLPARTTAAQHRMDVFNRPPGSRAADGPEDRERLERCVMGRSVPFFAFFFYQRVLIVQTHDHVAMLDEFGELRHIPVSEAARPSESIRQWGGVSRGRWEGDSLVVETTHLNGKWSFQGAGPNMRLVERFTRRAEGALDYEFTVDDPESFAASWTVTFPMTTDPGPLYEYACHEGNYSMPLILSGARAEERAEQDR